MAQPDVTPPSQTHGTFAALRLPAFRRFWAGTMVSNMGTWMQSVAQGWLMLQLTDSPFMLGVVGFANTIPSVLFTLLGGVAADRFDRRKVCFAAQSVNMVAAFVLGTLISTGAVRPWHIVVLAFTNGLAWAMSGSSFHSIIGDMAGKELRGNAIALNSMQFHLSRSIGPSLAGIILAHYGAATCFYGNGVSFVFVLYALVMLTPMPRPALPQTGAWDQLKAGVAYTAGNRTFVGLLVHTVCISGLGMPIMTLLPVVARDVLHTGASGLGHLMAASGIGAVCGALLLARRASAARRGPRVLLMGILYGTAIITIGSTQNPWLAMAMLALGGAASVTSQATVNTLLQTLSDDSMRGRVLSIYNLAFVAAMPLGNLLSGWLAQTHGASVAITVLGSLMVALISGITVFSPTVRQID
ncbi:MAG: MFS transporter [Candidatus Sericytochromatia bacterium]|nr:MFS transporter [Candidatus Sericytochromatia bacterium]